MPASSSLSPIHVQEQKYACISRITILTGFHSKVKDGGKEEKLAKIKRNSTRVVAKK